jgi:Tfp pilus assembly protein PilO
MKPLPVQAEKTHKTYALNLSMAGKLHEIIQFVTDVTNRPTITGLKGFSLRAIQGSYMVECQLSLWMVRLIREPVVPTLKTKPEVAYGK